MPVASIGGGDLHKVWEIKTLQGNKDDDARKLLGRVAEQVQPIMRKRKWRVVLLSEFCPSNPSLLGLNVGGGQEIRIRLRRFHNDPQLFAYEEVLGTMLHELTHIQCGPHDGAFYKLLDEITKECEELMVKGIKGTGQGFDAPGHRLGGVSHNPPLRNLRLAALAAAERRSQVSSLMPSGSCQLGGDREIMKALSPVQAAAMAAERRLRDDLWCAAPATAGEDGFQKAQDMEETKGRQVQDMSSSKTSLTTGKLNLGSNTQDRSLVDLDTNNAVKKTAGSTVGTSTKRRADIREGKSVVDTQEFSDLNNLADEEGQWECRVCTLHNSTLAQACAVCETVKPINAKARGRTWTCKHCTLENEVLLDNCAACDQWRFSHGAPAGTRGPNVGT